MGADFAPIHLGRLIPWLLLFISILEQNRQGAGSEETSLRLCFSASLRFVLLSGAEFAPSETLMLP